MSTNSTNNEALKSGRISDERRLILTALAAFAAVAIVALILKSTTRANTWIHDFFFARSFVQWVLLVAFAVGLIQLLAWRISAWRRERRSIRSIERGESPISPTSMAARRWMRLQNATTGGGSKNSTLLAKHLAEHDEAELDAAYRVSGDIVQVLPLIGFFGTVFGLSRGLYGSFLSEGGTSTKAFAKAIAIAFDNTLLGLALTIVLFAVQSILRKREDAVMLEVNLLANDLVTNRSTADVEQTDIEEKIKPLVDQFERLRGVLEAPGNELSGLIRTHSTAVKELTDKTIEEQKANHTYLNQLVSERLKEMASGLQAVVSGAIGTEAANAKRELDKISGGLASLETKVNALPEECRQIQALATSIKDLALALSQRDSLMLENLKEHINARSSDLKSATAKLVNRPRTLTILETPTGDGEVKA